MSVVVEFELESEQFELGRVLEFAIDESIRLETVVPTGECAVPSFWAMGIDRGPFERRIRAHPTTEELTLTEAFENRKLYALRWNRDQDVVFREIRDHGGQLLQAEGSVDDWGFEVRFPNHGALSAFQDALLEESLVPTVRRVFSPEDRTWDDEFGLTDRQREALKLAAREGYYCVPREITTTELGERLGVSGQAVTERLRRGVDTLATNTLLTESDSD
jgi:predicted DNA binding protein